MRKRSQTRAELIAKRLLGNLDYFGLRRGQIVQVAARDYRGLARVVGAPKKGPGIYVFTTDNRQMLVPGEAIEQATEPS